MKAEEILRQDKYKKLKNLILICEAMEEYAAQEVKRTLTSISVHIHTSSMDIHFEKQKP